MPEAWQESSKDLTPRPPPDIFTSATGREPTNKRFSFRITKTTSLTKKQIAEHLVKGN
jgi:hypothetical protein